MTKQHFNAIAEAIRTETRTNEERERMARIMADVCKGFNSRFQEERFLRACGVSK